MSAQSNDKEVCKFASTHSQPLFLEGSLKVAVYGSLRMNDDNDSCGRK